MPKENQARWRGVYPTPKSALTSNQKSVGTTDTEILDANTERDYALVRNISSTDVYVRPAETITTSNGELLHEGDCAIYKGYQGAISGITASGSATVYYEEG